MDEARKRFGEHKHNARRRGIRFCFTFDSWVAWWVCNAGDEWLSKRGRSKGKYCMARNGDAGPYAEANVTCKLHSDNASDMVVNGTSAAGIKSGRAKIDDTAAASIFTSTDKVADLAERYSVSIGVVIDIRTRRTWKHVTSSLHRTSQRGRNQWA